MVLPSKLIGGVGVLSIDIAVPELDLVFCRPVWWGALAADEGETWGRDEITRQQSRLSGFPA